MFYLEHFSGIFYIWVCIYYFLLMTGIAGDQSIIITPPKNLTGVVDDSAKFVCEIENSGVMSWEYNNEVVYTYQHGAEDYPKGSYKYTMVQDGRSFALTVNHLQISDGGKYTCRIIPSHIDGYLVVLDKPTLIIPDPTIHEWHRTLFTCYAKFGGPSVDRIAPNHYPRLKMFINDTIVKGATGNPTLELGPGFFLIRQGQYAALSKEMDEKRLKCMFYTIDPPGSVNASTKIHFHLPAQNPTEPSTSMPTQNLTEQFTSNMPFTSQTKSILISSTPGTRVIITDTWKTGLAVTIPLGIALVAISLLFLRYRVKRQPEHSQHMRSENLQLNTSA